MKYRLSDALICIKYKKVSHFLNIQINCTIKTSNKVEQIYISGITKFTESCGIFPQM